MPALWSSDTARKQEALGSRPSKIPTFVLKLFDHAGAAELQSRLRAKRIVALTPTSATTPSASSTLLSRVLRLSDPLALNPHPLTLLSPLGRGEGVRGIEWGEGRVRKRSLTSAKPPGRVDPVG
jgi:hypothetical protein